MTDTSFKKYIVRDGKIVTKNPLSAEERARRKAELQAFGQRCRKIFERVRPDLIKDHYNWFILIEPDSGDYFIDPDEDIAKQKAHQKYPNTMCLVMRINETGACGRMLFL